MKRLVAGALVSVLVSACGGGGDSGSNNSPPPPPPPVNASIGGIWEGTTSQGENVLGLVAETGEFHFINEDMAQYVGTAVSNVNAVNASYTGFANFGFQFADGSTSGTGTLTGTVQERSTLTATSNFTTSLGNLNSTTLTLTYNALYDRDSSLATIAGNFQDSVGVVLNINSNGVAFLQEPTTGCVLNGQVSTIDTRYNAYRIQWTFASCQGQNAVLNGIVFHGLATLDNTTSPEVLIIGATGESGGVTAALVLGVTRT